MQFLQLNINASSSNAIPVCTSVAAFYRYVHQALGPLPEAVRDVDKFSTRCLSVYSDSKQSNHYSNAVSIRVPGPIDDDGGSLRALTGMAESMFEQYTTT